jgi:hypothetical protein
MEYGFRYPIPQSGDASLEIARSTVPRLKHVNKFGENPDIDSTEHETIWGGGGWWELPASGPQVFEIFSTSANDVNLTGTGMWSVQIEGLDTNGLEQSEVVLLNGATHVNTVGTYMTIQRMFGLTWGSVAYNQGNIRAVASVDATDICQIRTSSLAQRGLNQSTHGVYTIPANYRGYMSSWTLGGLQSAIIQVDGFLWKQVNGQTGWRLQGAQSAYSKAASSVTRVYSPQLVFDPLDTIAISASVQGAANNTIVKAEFDLTLELIT